MTIAGLDTWRDRARALHDELVAAGKLSSQSWRRAVLAVPRHHFVPCFYQRQPGAPGHPRWRRLAEHDPQTQAEWWSAVWANTSLVTAIGDLPDGGRDRLGPVSSSSAPGLVTRMLEMLDIDDTHRVLEIGTGTGWNAGLLCHALGADRVVSVDIDEQLVAAAGQRLASLGYKPTLVHGDGAAGVAAHAPYDRILATCAVSRVPLAWCEQIRDGGRILVDLKVSAVAGNLVLLQRNGDRLDGHFDTGNATFMQMRSPTAPLQRTPEPDKDHAAAGERASTLPIQRPWEHPILWFLAHLTVPGRIEFGYTADPDTGGIGPLFLHSRDGSWCEVTTRDDNTHAVTEGGPQPLWRTLERLHQLWTDAGKPGWDRFRLTIATGRQTVWLEGTDHCWELPPARVSS